MNGNGRAGGGIFGVIGPGISGGFVRDVGGLQRDRRIAGAIHALRAFQADPQAPVRIVAKGQDEYGVVGRLRGRRTRRQLLWGLRGLAERKRRQPRKKQGCGEQNLSGPLMHVDGGSPDKEDTLRQRARQLAAGLSGRPRIQGGTVGGEMPEGA